MLSTQRSTQLESRSPHLYFWWGHHLAVLWSPIDHPSLYACDPGRGWRKQGTCFQSSRSIFGGSGQETYQKQPGSTHIWLTSGKINTLKYNFMASDICIHFETLTTVKIMNISTTSCPFVIPLSCPYLPLTLSPSTTDEPLLQIH